MHRYVRLLAVPLALGIVAVLALMPVGHVGQHQRSLVAGLVDPPVALARFSIGIITPEFTASPPELQNQGRKVIVIGNIACDAGEIVRVRVTVTQLATDESDGALAEGSTQDFCTGDIQVWTVEASTRSSTVLEPGPARVCALATTQGGGPINDAFQWCKDVSLVE